ncbi:ATP-dependent DNA helicase [Candidatus Woesearchaeota archaeon]|nr:ATP-dependent DNA helicase [Candidatus Woesearchaeota archaeon]
MPLLFPYDTQRTVQSELIDVVRKCVEHKIPLVVHAPTGLGKTAATLAPALTFAAEKDLTVFFLTSRQTQHLIALETMKAIKTKFNVNRGTVSIVGKKHLCAQPGASLMRSDDFASYCKSLREEGKCSYYLNARNNQGAMTIKADASSAQLLQAGPCASETVLQKGIDDELCPYELSLMLAENAKVIIADYNHLFNKRIRETLLNKIHRKLEQCIVIIDEGHNLPGRLREQLTQRISTITLRRAINEAKKHGFDDLHNNLQELSALLQKMATGLYRDQEKLVTKEQFVTDVTKIRNVDEFAEALESAADDIRMEEKTSSMGTIADFLNEWTEGDTGFSRILSVKDIRTERAIILSHRCLDPSLLAKDVIDNTHCAIIMSGTLTPTTMFADILGFPKHTIQKALPSPFPASNKCCLIVPNVTTKFTQRSDAQYQNIASACANIVNSIKGCSAVYFPSYAVRDSVAAYLSTACTKTVFTEDPKASKEEREGLLQRFAQYKELGAVLLGVAAGSFGEGVDLPGVLKCVIVVGIPLDRPDLETKELINYYDKKFHKGWDYGYVLPAITKTLQNAGRCIRSETDRGVLVFMDERYAQPMYGKCFPDDWEPKVVLNPVPMIQEFFATR